MKQLILMSITFLFISTVNAQNPQTARSNNLQDTQHHHSQNTQSGHSQNPHDNQSAKEQHGYLQVSKNNSGVQVVRSTDDVSLQPYSITTRWNRCVMALPPLSDVQFQKAFETTVINGDLDYKMREQKISFQSANKHEWNYGSSCAEYDYDDLDSDDQPQCVRYTESTMQAVSWTFHVQVAGAHGYLSCSRHESYASNKRLELSQEEMNAVLRSFGVQIVLP